MTNDEQIKKLIENTKQDKIAWEVVPDKCMMWFYSPFQTRRQNKILVIDRFPERAYDEALVVYRYRLFVCDFNYARLGIIEEDDLCNETNLARLYRLAERQANMTSDVINLFLED